MILTGIPTGARTPVCQIESLKSYCIDDGDVKEIGGTARICTPSRLLGGTDRLANDAGALVRLRVPWFPIKQGLIGDQTGLDRKTNSKSGSSGRRRTDMVSFTRGAHFSLCHGGIYVLKLVPTAGFAPATSGF